MPNDPSEPIDDLGDREDPRLNPDFWRTVPAGEDRDAAVLVGVVHDHPASQYRVGALARAFDPDTLALELPHLAVPFFEHVARANRDDGSAGDGERVWDGDLDRGGEMTAAIAARPGAEAVGIDRLDSRFFSRLAANAVGERASLATVRRALSDVATIARDAVAYRLGRREGAAEHGTIANEVTAADPPADQASDERTHVARSRSLLGAVERPHADLLLDGTREERMAAGIDSLRREGPVLAVVGMDHLEAVTTMVETASQGDT